MRTKKYFSYIMWVLALVATVSLAPLTMSSCHKGPHNHAGELWQCPMHPQITSDKKGTCPICQMDLVKVEKAKNPPAAVKTRWQCPMHPQIVSDKKGSCPICHMDLVQIEEPRGDGSSAGAGTAGIPRVPGYAPVSMTGQKRQQIGVRTEVVGRKHLTRTLRTYGSVSHDTELYGAQQEYLSAWRYVAEAKKTGEVAGAAQALLSASRKKLVILGYREDQLSKLEQAGVSDESLIVAHGMRVWVDAQVYESDLPYVYPGQGVRIQLPSQTGHAFLGTIQSMGTRVNPETRSVTARILSEHTGGAVVHDSYVQVLFTVPLGVVLAIPESAILDSGTRAIAFVAKGEGSFEPRTLILGRRGEGYVELLGGVTEGEAVVVKANFLIDSESQLRAALEIMADPTAKSNP